MAKKGRWFSLGLGWYFIYDALCVFSCGCSIESASVLDCLWCLRSWRESVAESGNSVKPCADFFTHGTVSSLVERLGLMLLYHVALRLVFLPWNVDLKVDLGIVTIHLQQHGTGCRPQWISMLPSYHKLQHSTPLHLAFFQSRIPSPASTRRLLPNQNQVEPSKQGTHPQRRRHCTTFPKTRPPTDPSKKKTTYPHTDPALGHLYVSTLRISIHVLISYPPTP